MKRFVVSLAQQKGVKPPAGYTKSGAICRGFFDQHASRKGSGGETIAPRPADPVESSSKAAKPVKRRRKAAATSKGSMTPEASAPAKRSRKLKADVAPASSPARRNAEIDTPLQIPYGNKEVALKLGARYRSGGWYAPPGVDLAAFDERGWI
jgi:DNA topoisomerase-3